MEPGPSPNRSPSLRHNIIIILIRIQLHPPVRVPRTIALLSQLLRLPIIHLSHSGAQRLLRPLLPRPRQCTRFLIRMVGRRLPLLGPVEGRKGISLSCLLQRRVVDIRVRPPRTQREVGVRVPLMRAVVPLEGRPDGAKWIGELWVRFGSLCKGHQKAGPGFVFTLGVL